MTTLSDTVAELRRLHAAMLEAQDKPLAARLRADTLFIRAAKDSVPSLLEALERRTKVLTDLLAPPTIMGDADTISAVMDYHELISETIRAALEEPQT